MRKNPVAWSGILTIFVLLAVSTTTLASADNAETKTISTSMNGFAFTNDGCCPSISTSLNGEIVTNTDGAITLLEQSGSVTIGSVNYKLEFTPSDKITISTVTGDCSAGTTYQQNGDLSLVGDNGTIIKGSAVYSWGTLPNCSGNQQFSNFSGKMQDVTGQPVEFYTGSDLMPDVQ